MERFGPIDPYRYARQSGIMQSRIFSAASHLKNGLPEQGLSILRETLEQFDLPAAQILWPTEAAE